MKLVYISAGVVNAEEDRELPGLKKAYCQAGASTIKKRQHAYGMLDVARKLLRKSKSVILTDVDKAVCDGTEIQSSWHFF